MITVPPQYRDAAIADFPEHEQAVAEWLASEVPGLMTLTGPCGTGKTRMMYAIAHKCQDARLWDVPTLVVKVQRGATLIDDGVYNIHERRIIDELIAHDRRVLMDDLGAEKTTDFVLQELYRLISQRELWDKPTLFTTNLDLDTLGKKLDDRIASRLAGGIVLEFGGDDHRLERKAQQFKRSLA